MLWVGVGCVFTVGSGTTIIAPVPDVTTKITPQVKLATFTLQ